jgi:Leu/Phe-tRNA-protein transferase
VLSNQGFELIDCQVASGHLLTLGAALLPRHEFATILDSACDPATTSLVWPDSPLSIADLVSDQAGSALQ